MRITPRHLRFILSLATLLVGAPAVAGPFWWSWSISEFQPEIANGGRANSIAIDPANDDHQWVASESGGVFQSVDRGVTWQHIEQIGAYQMGEITYLPSDPTVMLATAADDYTAQNDKGGLWRSNDAGLTWTHLPPLNVPGVGTRFAASDISIAPDNGTIYVATTLGLAVSVDEGLTWSVVDPMSSVSVPRSVHSVVALSNGIVLASGYNAPLRRSVDGGQTWATAGSAAVSTFLQHAFGISVFDPLTVYYVDLNKHLFYSEDAGVTWNQITAAPTGGTSCGGIGFVRTHADLALGLPGRTRNLRIFFGNRCDLYVLNAPEIGHSGHFDYSGTWTAAALDHGDTRDLAFAHGKAPVPLLLGTDGGLHITSDGGAHWTFAGAGHHGYHALQILDIKGQQIRAIPRTDLYFTTQDNSVWASSDDGRTWTPAPAGEGYFLDRQPSIQNVGDSLITFLGCGNCQNVSGPAQLTSLTAWPNAPSYTGAPAVVMRAKVLQNVRSGGSISAGLAVTADQGATWAPYGAFPETHFDLPRSSLLPHGGPYPYLLAPQVQYQSIMTGFDSTQQLAINHLVKVTKPRRGAAVVTYPAMNGFGGFGMRPAAAGWYEVFAVDPLQGNHLIAPDLLTGKVMESFDGGDNWSDISNLSAMVSDSGRYLARHDDYPFVQAVSFSAQDSQLVAVGTFDNGVFVSMDGGTTWDKVPGSEQATFVSSIEWLSASDLIVSTYGRGLWRIHGQVSLPKVPRLCDIVGCQIRYLNLGDPPPESFDGSILVVDGEIHGVSQEGGVVQQLAISAGSALAYGGDVAAVRTTVTATAQRDALKGLPGASEAARRHWALVGLGVSQGNRLQAAFYAAQTITASAHSAAENLRRSTSGVPKTSAERRSPTRDKPYLSIDGGNLVFTLMEQRPAIPVTLYRSPVAGALEILTDGRVVGSADSAIGRTVRAAIPVPTQPGRHLVLIRSKSDRQVVGGCPIYILQGESEPRESPDRPHAARSSPSRR